MNNEIEQLLRPDSPGFFWRMNETFSGIKWDIVKAKMIEWPEESECDDAEQLLACSSGGCWIRCDMINKNLDTGVRFIKANPPSIQLKQDNQ